MDDGKRVQDGEECESREIGWWCCLLWRLAMGILA